MCLISFVLFAFSISPVIIRSSSCHHQVIPTIRGMWSPKPPISDLVDLVDLLGGGALINPRIALYGTFAGIIVYQNLFHLKTVCRKVASKKSDYNNLSIVCDRIKTEMNGSIQWTNARNVWDTWHLRALLGISWTPGKCTISGRSKNIEWLR